MNVGDEITVFVKDINFETHKISLGYKTEETNPWNLIQSKFQVGDDATVKIVSLTTFGAFAELMEGIDGLIHISQITDHKIANPAEVLKVGDEVKVRILDINYDTHRVSLSMRALLEEARAAEEETIVSENAEYMAPAEDEPIAEPAPVQEADEPAPAEDANTPAEE